MTNEKPHPGMLEEAYRLSQQLAKAKAEIARLTGELDACKFWASSMSANLAELNNRLTPPPSADAMEIARNLLLELGCCFFNRREPTLTVARAITQAVAAERARAVKECAKVADIILMEEEGNVSSAIRALANPQPALRVYGDPFSGDNDAK